MGNQYEQDFCKGKLDNEYGHWLCESRPAEEILERVRMHFALRPPSGGWYGLRLAPETGDCRFMLVLVECSTPSATRYVTPVLIGEAYREGKAFHNAGLTEKFLAEKVVPWTEASDGPEPTVAVARLEKLWLSLRQAEGVALAQAAERTDPGDSRYGMGKYFGYLQAAADLRKLIDEAKEASR